MCLVRSILRWQDDFVEHTKYIQWIFKCSAFALIICKVGLVNVKLTYIQKINSVREQKFKDGKWRSGTGMNGKGMRCRLLYLIRILFKRKISCFGGEMEIVLQSKPFGDGFLFDGSPFYLCMAVLFWQARHAIKKQTSFRTKKSGLWSNDWRNSRRKSGIVNK